MVAARYILIDGRVINELRHAVTHEEIVNTPADVLFAGFKHIAPPSIGFPIGILKSESIGKAGLKQVGHFLSFFIGKARVAVI